MKIKVASIQMSSALNDIDSNLLTAEKHIAEAVNSSAKLVLLPEFMPGGYGWTRNIWNAAEPREGKTLKWLCDISERYEIYLGTTYLEARGEDFFNSFVLTGPTGKELGRVRKKNMPAYEAFFFRNGTGKSVIKTEIGNIGVGICYDSWFSYLPRIAQKEDFDLLLLPHSSPVPQKRSHIAQKHIDRFIEDVRVVAERYSSLLGIPVVVSNKCGKFESSTPLGPPEKSEFPGLSAISESDGKIVAQMSSHEEGYIVAEVSMDKMKKRKFEFAGNGRWAWEGPWQRNLMIPIEFFGRLSYAINLERRKRAKEIGEELV